MGSGFRTLKDGNDILLDFTASERIFQYEQTLIFESQHFDYDPNFNIYHHTGPLEEYFNIRYKTDRWTFDHYNELYGDSAYGKKLF